MNLMKPFFPPESQLMHIRTFQSINQNEQPSSRIFQPIIILISFGASLLKLALPLTHPSYSNKYKNASKHDGS